MMYLTGKHALNLPCSLETCGDWHMTALDWTKLDIRLSEDSPLGDYGIEGNKANHLRAILDLVVSGQENYLIGFYNDFIVVDIYNEEFMAEVIKLKVLPNWNKIDELMIREFNFKWIRFKEKCGM